MISNLYTESSGWRFGMSILGWLIALLLGKNAFYQLSSRWCLILLQIASTVTKHLHFAERMIKTIRTIDSIALFVGNISLRQIRKCMCDFSTIKTSDN